MTIELLSKSQVDKIIHDEMKALDQIDAKDKFHDYEEVDEKGNFFINNVGYNRIPKKHYKLKKKPQVYTETTDYSFVYRNLQKYGNCLITKFAYDNRLDKEKLGKHRIIPSRKLDGYDDKLECYIIERIE